MTERLVCMACDQKQHEGHKSESCYFCGKRAVQSPRPAPEESPPTLRAASSEPVFCVGQETDDAAPDEPLPFGQLSTCLPGTPWDGTY